MAFKKALIDLNSWFVLRSCSRATSATDAPGRSACSLTAHFHDRHISAAWPGASLRVALARQQMIPASGRRPPKNKWTPTASAKRQSWSPLPPQSRRCRPDAYPTGAGELFHAALKTGPRSVGHGLLRAGAWELHLWRTLTAKAARSGQDSSVSCDSEAGSIPAGSTRTDGANPC